MNHQAKKKFGQNFLKDKNLLVKIVNSANLDSKNVIEVGPGRGALTEQIKSRAKKLVAYEIDKTLKPILNKFESENSKTKYIDFLTIDLDKEITDEFNDEEVALIGNLPYYITTPIIIKALEINKIREITIMVQKEVADKLIPNQNQKNHSTIMSLIIQYQANISRVMNVDKKMFFPVPKVDSTIIRIEKLTDKKIEVEREKLFLDIINASFKQKRKTLLNNLFDSFEIQKEELMIFINELNMKKEIRAEELTLDDFLMLTRKWQWQ